MLPRPIVFVFADCDDAALKTNAIKTLYRASNAIFGFHFDERDSLALVGISAPDNRNRGDLSNHGKMVTQFSLIGFVR